MTEQQSPSEPVLEPLSNVFLDLTEKDCDEYFDIIEKPCDKVDSLVALMDRCKLMAAQNQSKAEEYSEASKLWERRLSKLQGYGIRLLNKQPMKSIETDQYLVGLEVNIAEMKCGLTRKYSTDNMIPDELIFSIPEKYRYPKVIWEMRSDYVRDTLLSGNKLNFAKLIDKQRLRIINKSEETL